MKILIAPNSFKECASSLEIASIISKELVLRNISNYEIFPVSDGGDDFLDIYKYYFFCDTLSIKTRNCFNNQFKDVQLAYDKEQSAYILESAEVIGLRNIPFSKRTPLKLNSENLGTLLWKLINEKKAKKILIGLGGTGTTDLGLGLCRSFGLRTFDIHGNELDIIPENFQLIDKITLPQKNLVQIEAVADVVVPLYGKKGAAYIFAGQKGATEEEIPVIDKGIRNIIRILEKDHNISFRNKLIGAAGGLSLGLSLISSFSFTESRKFLIGKLNLLKRISGSDLIITAEGKFDQQSFMHKASGEIIKEALKMKKLTSIITGECHVDFSKFDVPPLVFELIKLLGSKETAIKEYQKGLKAAIDLLVNKLQL